MALLGDLSYDQFLNQYWQQKPLLVRQATQAYNQVVSPEELAGLACEAEIESRLIIQHTAERWSLEQGPLAETRFSELPENGWTILLQAMDLWLPEVHAILSEFDFLPSWRLDDVMISYAAPGGGVGPHFDYYDVFLLQTSGAREWQLGQKCDHRSALRAEQPLKLLEHFEQTACYQLNPGDMLYVPAGIAHWGTSLNDQCITWSIGFRAPSAQELLLGAVEHILENHPNSQRFTDSQESLRCRPGEINQAARQQLHQFAQQLDAETLVNAMTRVLGSTSTELRYPENEPEPDWDEDHITQQLSDPQTRLNRSPTSRVAFHPRPENPRVSDLFVNGETYQTATQYAEKICAPQLTIADLAQADGTIGASERALLHTLCNANVYEFDE